MERNLEGHERKSGRTALARVGAGALRLILDGISARAHAITGTRPSAQNRQSMPACVVAEE
ncbi:MAG: hypothetical protein WCY92_02485 [Novosphingobium sp.]